MLTKKYVKRSFTFKFRVKVWSCNRPLSNHYTILTLEQRLIGYLRKKINIIFLIVYRINVTITFALYNDFVFQRSKEKINIITNYDY